jgi:hypothetical protein
VSNRDVWIVVRRALITIIQALDTFYGLKSKVVLARVDSQTDIAVAKPK